MMINGYTLREAIRRWELQRDTCYNQFQDSLNKFPDEVKPDPQRLAADFQRAEDTIAVLQTAQQRYNLEVKVEVMGIKMPLGQAVKRIGGAGRLEKMWRDVVASKKDRYSYKGDETRKTDEIRAARTVTIGDAMNHNRQASKFAGAMRAAIATGNGIQLDASLIGLDIELLKE